MLPKKRKRTQTERICPERPLFRHSEHIRSVTILALLRPGWDTFSHFSILTWGCALSWRHFRFNENSDCGKNTIFWKIGDIPPISKLNFCLPKALRRMTIRLRFQQVYAAQGPLTFMEQRSGVAKYTCARAHTHAYAHTPCHAICVLSRELEELCVHHRPFNVVSRAS